MSSSKSKLEKSKTKTTDKPNASDEGKKSKKSDSSSIGESPAKSSTKSPAKSKKSDSSSTEESPVKSPSKATTKSTKSSTKSSDNNSELPKSSSAESLPKSTSTGSLPKNSSSSGLPAAKKLSGPRFETLQVHAGQEHPDPTTDARAVPIYQTTSYVFKDCATGAGRFSLTEGGNIYTRIMNPTWEAFEKRVAALEGAPAALALASGAAATLYAIQNITRAGDHVVADVFIYGGSYNLFQTTFKDLGVEFTFVDGTKIENWEKAIKPNTKAFFFESLGNPNSSIIDIEAVSAVAHAHKIPVIVDNTFSTPYLLRPLEHGADIVLHSATKFIGGHGTSIGGIVVDGGKFDWEKADGKFPGITAPNPAYHGLVFSKACGPIAYIMKMRTTLLRDTGACLAPLNAFLFLQGLETLSLRIERHVFNALKVVEYLSKNPKVSKVNHPSLPNHPQHALYKRYFPNGGSSIFTFELKGTKEDAIKWIEKLKLHSMLANVADVKSLVIHPASTTHSQMDEKELLSAGITPTTIRLSVGIEHISDILADLEQAFK